MFQDQTVMNLIAKKYFRVSNHLAYGLFLVLSVLFFFNNKSRFNTMKKYITWVSLAIAGMLFSCNDDKLNAITIVDSAFQTGTDGWTAQFSEYSTTTDSISLQMQAGRARLPIGLDTTKYAFRIQAQNGSDDMFMYLKKKVTGFIPNQNYSVTFEMDLGTQYPENSLGAGGSPGSSVYLKAGAVATEPNRKLEDKFYHFNLDKGQQSESGKDAVLLGNVSNGVDQTIYKLVRRSNLDKPINIKANAQGEIWLFVGSDSGFEGLTVLYYDHIRVTIIEQPIE